MSRFTITIDELRKYRYGEWAGNPKGIAYDPDRCAYEIWNLTSYQCNRKKGHGFNGLYCKQHAKMVVSK